MSRLNVRNSDGSIELHSRELTGQQALRVVEIRRFEKASSGSSAPVADGDLRSK
jgi:hypothetical protein